MDDKLMQRARLWVDASGSVYRDGEPCACSDNGYGYLKCRAGNHTFKVHQIAAEQWFAGPDLSRFPFLSSLFPRDQWDVAHKDRDKKNNRMGNLSYVPHSFNMRHESQCPLVDRLVDWQVREDRRAEIASKHPCGRHWCRPKALILSVANGNRARRIRSAERRAVGTVIRPGAKLKQEQAAEIRKMAGSGASKRSIARAFGISATQVDRIVRGTHWLPAGGVTVS